MTLRDLTLLTAAAAAAAWLSLAPAPAVAGSGGTGWTAGCEDLPPDPAELLHRAEATYDELSTLRARFHQVLVMEAFDPPRRNEGEGTWYQKRPDRFRMDFDDPEGDVVVADGRHVWLYYPSSRPGQVVRSSLERGDGTELVDLQGRIFREARFHYDAEYVGCEKVKERAAHRVLLRPVTATPYRRVELWIDAESLLVRRLEFEDHSETRRTITLEDLEPGVELPESLFEFEPPEDVDVFEG